MTYTIELDATEERVLEAAAARGVALDSYLREVLKRQARREAQADEKEIARRAAVKRGRGMFAHCGETPEERRRAKDEELRREAAL